MSIHIQDGALETLSCLALPWESYQFFLASYSTDSQIIVHLVHQAPMFLNHVIDSIVYWPYFNFSEVY